MVRVSLAISHTPWVTERVESLNRLMSSLPLESFAEWRLVTDKAPNHIWSETMWKWAIEQEVDYCLFLQDDTVVAPDFYNRLTAILEMWPDKVIGLQVAHPVAVPLAEFGFPGFTTTDALVGVGYVLPRGLLAEFLEWRATQLVPGALEVLTEDTLIGIWCAATGRRIFHPIPTIVDHDVKLASTFGNDAHVNRRSLVRWDTPTKAQVQRTDVPHMGRFYNSTPHTVRHAVQGVTAELSAKLDADNGREQMRQLHYGRLAFGQRSRAKVFIASPTTGSMKPGYVSAVWRLFKEEEVDYNLDFEVVDIYHATADVIRTRGRMVTYFLQNTDATHMLFLDDDIVFLPKVIKGMLRANKDYVACPYPRREGVDWKRVRELTLIDAEAAAYAYSYQFDTETGAPPEGGLKVDETFCVPMKSMPLGCTLLSRNMLASMVETYRPFFEIDESMGTYVSLFFPFIINRKYFSEDYSFCIRARECGFQPHMFLGEGSPVDHWGSHLYRGHIEALGLRRQVVT